MIDDHTLFRRGLTALLARDARLKVVGDAGDASEGLRRARELQPDIILLDNRLPGVRGVDALSALHEAAPESRILMLTVSDDADDLGTAVRRGAVGYLLKTAEGDTLVAAILSAMDGESVIAPEMTSKLVAAYREATVCGAQNAPASARNASTSAPGEMFASLSPREMDVLRGIARGASNKEIAREHGIAETTVKNHVQHILRKLDVSTRVQAAVIASANGLT